MITFEIGGTQFNYRTVGIVMDGERALLHRAEVDDFWSLPGGRVEMLEKMPKTRIARAILDTIEELCYTSS